MGSYTSRHNANIVPKPLEVLPTTESWSTLDAFQATVNKDEHHELINRSKTQKSLIKRNSFLQKNYKRRTKTLNILPANTPPSEKQMGANKKTIAVRAKTQATLSPTRSSSKEDDSINPLPSQFSGSRLNARRPTHFYEVRQAMVNRKPLKKLDSIGSMNSSPNLKVKVDGDHISTNKPVIASNPAPLAKESIEVDHPTNDPVVSRPRVAESLAIEQSDHAEHLTVASPSAVKLENKTQESADELKDQIKEAGPLAVQLESNVGASQSGTTPSPEISLSAFKVDPTPHAMFAPDSQPSECELQCRATIAEFAFLSSEESSRKEVKGLLQQWEESGQLTSIEAHALSVPPSQTTTIAELASSLVKSDASYANTAEGNELHTQVAQAYCIYAWTANNIMYDVEQWKAYNSGDEGNLASTQAEEVLDTRVTACTGYANLFKALALAAGLQAEVVHGHAKQWKCLSEEKPDSDIPFKPSRENAHTWNSVMIGGVPYLLDCTFASGYVTSSANFCKSFNCYYFAVLPQQMILTHWPLNNSWQLLKEPLTLEKFQPLIPISLSTKGLGIEPESWSEIIEILDDPVACVRLRCKDNLSVFASLIACNEVRSCDVSKPYGQEKYVFSYRDENVMHIRATPPQKGKFFLNIYACESLEKVSSQSYRLVLSYLIQNKREIANQVGYPLITTAEASIFNFKLLYWNAPNRDYCCENSGKLEMVFRARPDLQFYHCILPGESGNGATPNPSQADDTYHFNTLVIQNEDGDPSLYMLRTVFPTQGWWTLNLYAKKPGNDINSELPQKGYSLVVTYNVYVQNGVPEQSYPNILSPYISMLQPDTISASGDEIFSFYFNSSKAFYFHSYLTFDQQTAESMDNFTAIENINGSGQCKLSVIFPKPGRWYVHVFGKDVNDPLQKSYSGLFVLQIKVGSSLKNTMFPKLNQPLAKALNVHYLNSGSIAFQDDGSPFVYKILVPVEGSVDLIHSIKPHNTGDTAFNEDFLQHCTSLSFRPCTDDSKSSIVYTLKAVFPWAGMWTVQLYAASMGSKRYISLIEVNLLVNNPTPDVCYIKIHPFFHHLDLNIPERFLSYNPTMDASEIEVPFKAPESVQFVWNMEFVKSGEKFFQQAIIYNQEKSLDQDSDYNHILHVIFPKPGEWSFHLYGRISSNDQQQKHSYQSVMEIRVKVSSFKNELGFPHIFDPFQSVFGMKLEKQKLPLINKVTSLPSKVSIPFYSPPNVKLWYDIEIDNSSNTQPTARLNHDSDSGHHDLIIEIDRKGKWTVIIYAQLTEAEKKNWTAVIKHTISSE